MKHIKRNFLLTVPVLVGYIVIGIGFGISLQSHGYGVIWALAMSLLIYAGSMQYMAVNLLSAGAGLVTVALTTLMVNARHLFYGLSMIEKYRDTRPYKPYLIFALTDETYSLVCTDDTLTDRDCFQISLLNQGYWVFGSVLGSVLGKVLPFDFTGIDFALGALFISVMTEQWITQKDHAPALIGLVSSVVSLAVFGADRFLLPAMALILFGLIVLKGFRKEATR